MIYTNAVQGVAKKITLSATPKTLTQLIGSPIDDKVNLITIYHMDRINSDPAAWYSYDATVTPSPMNAIPIFEGGFLEITKQQIPKTKFVSDNGTVDFWAEQFDSEGQTL